PAGHHGLLGGAVVFFGVHPKTRRRFVVQSIEGGGWGGRPFEDGEPATVSVCQGAVGNGWIEDIELTGLGVVAGRALRGDYCGAGGGWGYPTERDPALVRSDVLEELVSREAALEHYGVVLRDDLTLDETATQQRRDRLRSGRKA